ncbi:mitochondrial small ribosomal subunit Rsm22-domain-containing protein [Melampsora americana]|nr:mitochondrial small ribosomal subunit Rsm22-domain-containing protein [Melampsora americana]
MPSTYGATLRVFIELNQKLLIQKNLDFNHEESIKIIDFGSGTGAVAWAAKEIWKDSRIDYYGLEKSSSMIWLSDQLLNPTNEINSDTSTSESDLDDSITFKSKLNTSFHRLSISPHKLDNQRKQRAEDRLLQELEELEKDENGNEETDTNSQLTESKITEEDTLSSIQSKIKNKHNLIAIMSFTLSDLPNEESRRQAILQLWKTGAKTMIIIDRGTPSGFQLISMARVEASSWILAPCSHDLTCPLIGSKHFCHFSQRIQRPKFLKVTKHTLVDEEDCKFSYVIVRRGSRDECKFDETKFGLDDQFVEVNDHKVNSNDQVIELNQIEDPQVEKIQTNPINWPRIILPPHKKKGHVILDVCSSNGQIERMTIPKSQGKSDYYDARKSHWGDSWPHGSKKIPLIKEIKKLVEKK